jgi:hypothetical protein
MTHPAGAFPYSKFQTSIPVLNWLKLTGFTLMAGMHTSIAPYSEIERKLAK